jgi:Domain of unknown function (DUF4365)
MRNQTKSQIIGREGERWFSSLLPPQWGIQRPFDDFGLDGIVTVGTETNMLSLEFGVQIKSSHNFSKIGSHIVVPSISREMLEYWLRRFTPTLLVAYDVRRKIGYFDWIQNLITPEELAGKGRLHYLKINSSRRIDGDVWAQVKKELENYENDFRTAMHLSTTILPVCKRLAGASALLCRFELIDTTTRPGFVEQTTEISETYIAVAKEIDTLLSAMNPNEYASRILAAFSREYKALCREIFWKFDLYVSLSGGEPHWTAMKRPDKCVRERRQLNAMISDCIVGMLRHS